MSGLAVLVITMACAARIGAPPAPGPTTEPQASWIVKAGPEFGNEREVCRSDQDQACVVPASTEARPISAVVVVYLYPAGAKTSYRGSFQSGFMESQTQWGHETKVDYTADEGTRPTYVASAGRVASTPGEYEFKIALLAEVPGHVDPYQFEQTIPIKVTPAT
jgi:hypothetical protein